MARVVLDALAEAHFVHHFEVVVGAHLEALGFDEFAVFFEPGDAFFAFLADVVHGFLHFAFFGDELFGGEEGVGFDALDDRSGKGVDGGKAFDFVAEKFDADRGLVEVSGVDLDDVATDAEFSSPEGDVVAFEEEVDELFEEGVAVEFLSGPDGEHRAFVVIGTSQAVDAGDGGDDDDVLAGEYGTHRRKAEAFDLVVDGGVFLDVGVGAGDVGLGLVVVEVGDKVFDGVVGEEVLKLGVELGSEGFVVGHDQSRASDVLNDVGHGEGFAGTGDAEEGLMGIAGVDGVGELGDGLLLVPGGRVVADELEADGREYRASNIEGPTLKSGFFAVF